MSGPKDVKFKMYSSTEPKQYVSVSWVLQAYFMKEAQCKNVVKRQPDVLGYTGTSSHHVNLAMSGL